MRPRPSKEQLKSASLFLSLSLSLSFYWRAQYPQSVCDSAISAGLCFSEKEEKFFCEIYVCCFMGGNLAWRMVIDLI